MNLYVGIDIAKHDFASALELADSSLSVCSPLMASSATLALKAAE